MTRMILGLAVVAALATSVISAPLREQVLDDMLDAVKKLEISIMQYREMEARNGSPSPTPTGAPTTQYQFPTQAPLNFNTTSEMDEWNEEWAYKKFKENEETADKKALSHMLKALLQKLNTK